MLFKLIVLKSKNGKDYSFSLFQENKQIHLKCIELEELYEKKYKSIINFIYENGKILIKNKDNLLLKTMNLPLNLKEEIEQFESELDSTLISYSQRLKRGTERVLFFKTGGSIPFYITTETMSEIGLTSDRFLKGFEFYVNQARGTNSDLDEITLFLNEIISESDLEKTSEYVFSLSFKRLLELMAKKQKGVSKLC